MTTMRRLLLLGLLAISALAAHAQVQIVSPADSAISAVDRQAVTVKTVPGSAVMLSVNGNIVRVDTARIDGVVDFLNVPVPVGDVAIEAKLVSGGDPARRMIHVLGPPASLVIALERPALGADGTSSAAGSVSAYDAWHYRIMENLVLTVESDSGRVTGDDVDRDARGLQLAVKNGAAAFTYVAGNYSGTATLRASLDTLSASVPVALTTPYEKFTLVGLATGLAQSAKSKSDGATLISDDAYPDGLTTDGRLALYARGTVFNDYRLTASFDNDRRNAGRFYRDLDPDYLYSIYGDNSMLTYDAQTTRQLYARLERDKSYALVGDYATDLSKQEFTAYHRTLYGLKANHEIDRWRFTGFGSMTDRSVVQAELRGTGLSGFYNLGYLNITPGSERIRIETRDRYHSEVLLRSTDQYRFSDYEIDYAQGTIFFKQPVPAIDVQGNPTYIVVSFEAFDDRKKSFVGGARVEHDLLAGLTLGVDGVVEEQSPKNYTLLGADAKYTFDRSTLSGEIGRSDALGATGLAYKLDAAISPVPAMSLTGYYRQVEKGFTNVTQSGSGRELGTRKYGAGGTYQFAPGTKLGTEYYHSAQDAVGGSVDVQSLSGTVEHAIMPELTGSLKVEDFRYDGPSRDTAHTRLETKSLLASARLAYAATDRLTLSVQHDRNFGEDDDINKPNGTAIAGEYRLIQPVTIMAQRKFFEDGSGLSAVGLTATPFDGTSLYSKYEVGNAIGQRRNLLSIGLKNKLRLPYDLTANFGLERARSLETRLGETPTEDHVAYSGGLEYLPAAPVKASAKAEYGQDNLATKSNYFAGVDVRVVTDVSLIGKWYLSLDDARKGAGYQDRSHLILGMAYRPVASNMVNLIGKFEWKSDNNHYLAPFDELSAAIVSMHAYTELVPRTEVGFKVAYKHGNERTEGFELATHTYFGLVNARYYLGRTVDIGGEIRILRQQEAADYLLGYHAEIGYVAIDNMRVAAGWNFKGYKERDLVDYALWTEGPFIRLTYKFDESLFGW